jgi:5-methyltetrahydrofolate--homocysteine methyltransferase
VQQLRGREHGRDGARQDILAKARVEGADIIGLSGLITPSLEEMQHVAAEMQRDDYFREEDPAADRRRHHQPRAHRGEDRAALRRPGGLRARRLAQRGRVRRAAGRRARREVHGPTCEADYERVRELHANKKVTPLVAIDKARANKARIDWASRHPPVPKFIGRRLFTQHRPGRVGRCIDWAPFFQTWDLAGQVPGHPERRGGGPGGARACSATASACCSEAIDGRWLQANGVVGFWPANTVDDDTSSSTPTRRAARWRAALAPAAPADRAPGGRRGPARPTAVWPTSSPQCYKFRSY